MKNYFSRTGLKRENLIRDRDFLKDARIFLRERTGKEYESDSKVFDALVEHLRIGRISEITAFRDMNYIKKGDQETKDRVGRLFITFDRMKNPTGFMKLLGDYGEGLLRSPSTYISLTGVGVIGKGAAFGAQRLFAETGKALAATGIKKEATRAALRGAGIEAGVGAIQGAAYEGARQQTGRKEYEDRSLLGGALLGGALGAIPGAITGGMAGAKAFRQAEKAFAVSEEGAAATKKILLEGADFAKKEIYNNPDAVNMQKAFRTTFKKLTEEEELRLERGPTKFAPTDAERVRQGQALMQSSNDMRKYMSPEVLYNMEAGWVKLLLRFGVRAENVIDETTGLPKRISTLMMEAIDNRTADAAKKGYLDLGDEAADAVVELQTRLGLTDEQFGSVLVAQASDFGRGLAFFGKIKKAFKGTLAEFDKQTTIMNRLRIKGAGEGEELSDMYRALQSGRKAKQFFDNLDKARLAFMTMQTATTMRNTVGATFRSAMFLLDNMFRGALDLATAGGDAALRKQALSRMGSGVRLFHALTWNQAEANVLRMLFAESMPLTFRSVYRQNADVAAAVGLNSGIANFGRKLNILNTYSDNAFKRATFMVELQTQLGGADVLRTMVREGRFAELGSAKHLGKLEAAIIEAKSLVYQRSFKEKVVRARYKRTGAERGILGLRKKELVDYEVTQGDNIAAWFLEKASSVYTTWAMPFPKFIMNSLDFMWTHAPLLGTIGNVSKAGISKQMSGYLLLYGAVQLRAAQGPEARWWEMYDKESKTFINTIALYGPFAPYMLMADLIVRSNLQGEEGKYKPLGVFPVPLIAGKEEYTKQVHANWERVIKDPLVVSMVGDGMFREYMKSIFGATFRTGFVGQLAKDLEDDYRKFYLSPIEKKAIPAGIGKAFATFFGNYSNTFLVSMGEVRDIYSSIDPDYEKIHDTNAVTNSVGLFIAKALRSVPISEEGKYFGLVQGPEGIELLATDGTQREALRREGRDVTQFTGVGATEKTRIVDRELVRLDMKKWKEYRSFRGQPSLKRKANVLYAEFTDKFVRPYIESASFQNMPNTREGALRQRANLTRLFASMRTQVNNILAEQLTNEYNRIDLSPKRRDILEDELLFLYRIKYDKIPDTQQRLAEEIFKQQHRGRGPESTGEQGLRDILGLIGLARSL